MSTAAILLSAIAFISSSALTNMDSISVLQQHQARRMQNHQQLVATKWAKQLQVPSS
jgi:hypothetical protein